MPSLCKGGRYRRVNLPPPYFFSQFLPPPTFWSNFSLFPKLDLKIGSGQHTTPAVSHKVSFLTFRASPLHQHTAQRLCNHRMSCLRRFLWRKSPVGYSRESLVGVASRISKLWPYFRPKNVIIHTRFQTWPLNNSVIITVMIWFSAFLPISIPFQISAPLRMCVLLISTPSLLGAPIPPIPFTKFYLCYPSPNKRLHSYKRPRSIKRF